MKIMNKKVGIILGLLVTTTAFAENVTSQSIPTPSGIQSTQVQAGDVLDVGMQNDTNDIYANEKLPSLKEVSRKKSILEVKTLNNEIEKTDIDILKLKKENTPEPISKLNKTTNLNKTNNTLAMQQHNSNIKVLMTYGYTDDLFAKITNGSQGGYVVRRGDILPNGQQVISVNQNYIEVKNLKSKNKLEKIFVTGPDVVNTDTSIASEDKKLKIIDSSAGGAGSADMLSPLLSPQIFGKLSVPPMLTSVNNSLPIK
jgi:hypothetical protein